VGHFLSLLIVKIDAYFATAPMFEQTFKNIDDILHKDAGCTSELDYTEQSSWLLFLKYLDALEADKATEALLEGRDYQFILAEPFRWSAWAAPKGADGTLDHNAATTGDDLKKFVNEHLFPYLAGFKQRASGPQTIEYKIGEVFGEIANKIQSGYNLRDVIDRIDELRFGSQAQKHELSHLYEAKIKNMGNAGRNGGEYYTPRPLIRAMIQVMAPTIGERIYDPACGSAGFLCEAFAYLSTQATKADDLETLQKRTFYGKEKKSLAYVIGIMNMILHGIEAPNIVHTQQTYNQKQHAFLEFVLDQYVSQGIDTLEAEKLTPLLKLRYNNAIHDAVADLGDAVQVRNAFVGMQRYLYN
jgi:type I restriction enzyme M protein